MNLEKLETKQFVHGGVLIQRAHYYTIFVEMWHTIREGVLIEESALIERVRYLLRLMKSFRAQFI